MNSIMYTVFVARSIVHVKHVGGGGIVGHFIFFGVAYRIVKDSNADSRAATASLSQARSNILPQNFLTGCFL